MSNRDGGESVVVKGAVPKSLKLQFKILCVQNELEMSTVLKDLIEKWIQTDAPVRESLADLSSEDCEDVKGYIPKPLKVRFKAICTMKRVKMRSVLCEIIHEWVQTGNATSEF